MSIVEMSTIGDNFYNPPGGILVYLLKGVIKKITAVLLNKKAAPEGSLSFTKERKRGETALP